MTKLVWDAIGERNFESGLDRGVLYSYETSLGVAWNGLVSVEEKMDDGSTPFYQDGVKYIDAENLGHFTALLKAITYPDEFEQYEGNSEIAVGFMVHDQPPKRFHLSYRTKVGNDLDGPDSGYQIHILYNLTAVPNDKSYNTLTNQTAPMQFSWTILGVPVMIDGFRPTAHVIVDSRDIDPEALLDIENSLYGTESSPPYIPPIEELSDLGVTGLIIIVDHGDGTWSAINPDDDGLITMLGEDTFQITEANAVYLDADTYQIASTGETITPPPGEPDVFPSRLSASGPNMVDENNFILNRMTGVNVHCLPDYVPSQTDLDDIKAEGASWVRAVLHWDDLEPTQGVFDSTMQSQIDLLLSRCLSAELYVELELHLNVGAVPGWTSGVDETHKYAAGGEFITTELAQRYGGNKVVTGFGLNEMPAYQATLLYGNGAIPYLESVQRDMITWFRVDAPDWIGFVTLGYSNQTPYPDSPRTAADPNAYDAVGGNVVMDVHMYSAGVNSVDPDYDGRQPNGMIYPTWQGGLAYWISQSDPLTYVDTATHRSQMLAFLTDYVTFCTAANIPLMVGEVGWAINNTGGKSEWWDAILLILDAVNPAMVAQWMYSTAIPPQEYFAARPEGTWDPDVLALLATGD